MGLTALWVIARNTIQEAFRRKTLFVILLFALMIIPATTFFTHLAPAEEDRMLKDAGLSLITVFGMLISIFVGVTLIPPEVEKRWVYTVLSKPVRRLEFLLGKYVGALAVIAINVAIMAVVMVVVLYLKQKIWSPQLLVAVGVTYLGLALMTALVIMVSTLASTLLCVVMAFVFWAIGSLQGHVHYLATKAENEAGRIILTLINRVLPNFSLFDLRAPVIELEPIRAGLIGQILAYGLGYTAVVLALAAVLFNERQV